MNKKLLFAAALLISLGSRAQNEKPDFKFYGQVRTDAYVNSRSFQESADGELALYPLDKKLDANGKDLNAHANDGFYDLYSRMGVDVGGLHFANAKVSAKIEADFRGTGTTYSIFRLRHAYFNLDWKHTSLLLGQTWHPLYGDVAPQILNLSNGAPFQPFNRSPQIRFRYYTGDVRFTAAAVWQAQYLSIGPGNVKSESYIKNSCVPEIFAGIDYIANGWTVGVGGELLSLKPRLESTMGTATYKVSERITSLSGEAHVKYVSNDWTVAAKTILNSNLTQLNTVGGYGVKSINSVTGEQEYTPIRNSSTWLNITYGKKWRPGIYAGYVKNLGTSTEVASVNGLGNNIDHIAMGSFILTYNIPHWKIGMEYTLNSTAYGNIGPKAKVTDTHSVTGHRLMCTAIYMF